VNPTFARRASALAVLLAVTGPAAACSGAHPDSKPREKLPAATAFHAGSCRDSAADVLAVAELAVRYEGKKTIPSADRKKLAQHQDKLAAQAKTAADALKKPLGDLVTSIGFVRLRYASRSYDPKVLAQMDDARKTVQKACVGP
jgi:hypothetical protein